MVINWDRKGITDISHSAFFHRWYSQPQAEATPVRYPRKMGHHPKAIIVLIFMCTGGLKLYSSIIQSTNLHLYSMFWLKLTNWWFQPPRKIWVRQIGSSSQLLGKKIQPCSKPPTSWRLVASDSPLWQWKNQKILDIAIFDDGVSKITDRKIFWR